MFEFMGSEKEGVGSGTAVTVAGDNATRAAFLPCTRGLSILGKVLLEPLSISGNSTKRTRHTEDTGPYRNSSRFGAKGEGGHVGDQEPRARWQPNWKWQLAMGKGAAKPPASQKACRTAALQVLEQCCGK